MSEQKSAVETTEAAGTGGAGETFETGKASETVQAASTETAAVGGTGGTEEKKEPVVETKTEEAAVAETKPAEPVVETKTEEAAASANVAPEPAAVSSPSIEVNGEELSAAEGASKEWLEEEAQGGMEEESEDERQTAEVVDSKPAPAPAPEPASPAPAPASGGQLRARRGPSTGTANLFGFGSAAPRPSTPKQPEHKPAAQSVTPRQEAPKGAEVKPDAQPTETSRQESSSVTKIGFAPAPEPFLPEGFEDFLRLVLNDPDHDLPRRVEDFLCVGVKELNKQLNKAARLAGGRLEARLATARAMLKTQLVEDEPNRKVRVVIMFFVYRAYLYEEKDTLSCYRKAGSWLDESLKELNAPTEAPKPTDTATTKPAEKAMPFGLQPTIAADTPVRPTGASSGRPSNPEVVREQMSKASRGSEWDQPKVVEANASSAEVKPAEPQAPPAQRQQLRKSEDNPFYFPDPFSPLRGPESDSDPSFFRPREEKKAEDEKREPKVKVRPTHRLEAALLAIIVFVSIIAAIIVFIYRPLTSASSGEPTCEAARPALLQAQLGQSDPAHYKDECKPSKAPAAGEPFVDCRNRTFHVKVVSKKDNACDWDIRDCNVCYTK